MTKPEDSKSNSSAMQELRDLLFQKETARISAIEELLNNQELHAKEIAKVLAEAVQIRTKDGNKLGEALTPAVESALKASIARNPKPLSDALFPVMGPAIRKAIHSSIASMLQSLNQTLEHSFSAKGLQWRLDAFRTGKSFAEIVLLNTLVYRVEQVFLIHKETGILLQHLSFDPALNEDADVVSSMLTAVRDFIHDSFSGNSEQEVQSLKMGDLEIIVEQGPDTVLAVVNRGNAPRSLHEAMSTSVEDIQQEFHNELQKFDGDTSVFETSVAILSPLMISDYENQTKPGSPIKALASVAILFLILTTWFIMDYQYKANWQSYINHLNTEPGIVITHVNEGDEAYTLFGLRDPLSIDPSSILGEYGLTKEDATFQFQPYHALQAPIILKRVTSIIQPPASVSLTLENNVLFITGEASEAWRTKATQLALFVAGIEQVDDSKLSEPASLIDQVRQVIQPPSSIELHLKSGELKVKGEATQDWADNAAKSIRAFEQIKRYDDSEVTLIDSPLYLLKVAKRKLNPPQGVQLFVTQDKILLAKGAASTAWITGAKQTASNIKFIKTYNDSQLRVADNVVLERAMKALSPPASVSLAFSEQTLTATGEASQAWIEFAQIASMNVEGVSIYDSQVKKLVSDEEILHAAITYLEPPATVTLRFSNGILHASGSTSSMWIKKAEQEFMQVEGIHSFYTSDLVDTTSSWNHIESQVGDIHLEFEATKASLTEDHKEKLKQLALWYQKALDIDSTSSLQISITYSSNETLITSLRLTNIQEFLSSQAVPASNMSHLVELKAIDNLPSTASFTLSNSIGNKP